MLRKSLCLLAAMTLTVGLAACHQKAIVPVPTSANSATTQPRDSAKEDKQAAAQTHTQLAALYMQKNDLKQAEGLLKKAIGFDDKYVPAHTMLAILDWRIQRFDDANREFRAAIAIDPSNGDANNNYGKFLCTRGQYQDAMKYFQRALADPFYKTPAVANTNAGECQLKNNDGAGAEAHLAKALQIDASYGPALLAMAQVRLQQGDAFNARGFLQRFESAGQATPESLLLGYRIAAKLGDKDAASSYSNRLEDQFPDSSEAKSLGGSAQ